MSPRDPDLRSLLLQATEPEPDVTQRLRAAVTREVDSMRRVDGLAREIGHEPDAVSRLHDRLAGREQRLAGREPSWRWAPEFAFGGFALGGLAVGGLALGALALALTVGREAPSDPLDHVKLAFDGLGHVERTGEQPIVVWEEGRVDVELEPNVGARLAVQTPEALVQVVGTRFSVDRQRFATRVEVQHGVVEVTCINEPVKRVTAGEELTCLPTDPATLLRRVVALGSAGNPEERRATLEAALSRAPVGHPLRSELLARRVELLAGTADEGAIEAARKYLASGAEARRRAMLGFVAHHRFTKEGCEALPDLHAAVAEDPTGPSGVPLASCLAQTDPEQARAILARVTDPGPWAELRERLR